MRLKIILPIIVIIALGAGGWLFLESSGNSDKAGKAANAVMDAADRAIDAATAEQRFRATEELNYVNIGAIFTSRGHVRATLEVKGTDGVEAVCNRIAYVRDYLVVLMSDHPPTPGNVDAGPTDYTGSVEAEINDLIGEQAVVGIRYDPFNLGQSGAQASC